MIDCASSLHTVIVEPTELVGTCGFCRTCGFQFLSQSKPGK